MTSKKGEGRGLDEEKGGIASLPLPRCLPGNWPVVPAAVKAQLGLREVLGGGRESHPSHPAR